ncbi:MAG TPA: selenocysteine-specific translation elongation factor [Burkholderiales bacterium]|nr:selenocysteine-specific translation elongation factor [Burkholderiales bacterium]
MIIGTAGHIDHGKSTLVKALTGVDPVRLQEEKARGITIDLGFAYQPLSDGQVLGFVDVPGHEKFIHNMLAGATGIDYVMLVVAADDGPMPQTVEHLAILHLLGLSRGIVALSKADLVSQERLAEVKAEIQSLLAPTPLAGAPILPVSAVSGEGMAELRQHLLRAVYDSGVRNPGGHFRHAVDRCFTLQGVGVVVTGTVFSGEVKRGDKLFVSPSGIPVRVRSIHAQNQQATSGHVGQRCALNLAGVEKNDIKRGNWILAEAVHAPAKRFDAHLNLLNTEVKPLRHWTSVHVHVGACDVLGRVALLQANNLQPGDNALAQLVLDEPVGALHGDRFVVRDQSAMRTMGGGIIIDPFPPQRGRRKAQRLEILSALESATAAQALQKLLALSPFGVDWQKFVLTWNLNEAEAQTLSRQVAVTEVICAEKPLAFSSERWAGLKAQALQALQAYQKRFPNQTGATTEQVWQGFPEKLQQGLLNVVIGQLIEEKKMVREGQLLRMPGLQASLSAADQKLSEKIIPLLQTAGLLPPKVRELSTQLRTDEKQLKLLLRRFSQMGKLRQVSEDYYFAPEVIARLAALTQKLAQQSPTGTITVGQFREGTAVYRNLAIPLLEFFDRSGFTVRVDDGRRIRRDWKEVFGENKKA